MDMIVRLKGEDAGYVSTMNRGRESTWRLNSSLDNMTTAMERQLGTSATSTRQTEILALADRGASAAKVEYALSLANQVEAMELLNAAEAEQAARATAAKAAAEQVAAAASRQADADLRVLSALELKNIEMSQGAAAAKRYEIANSALSADAKEMALALMSEGEALRAKAAAEAAAANQTQRAKEQGEQNSAVASRQADAELKLLSAMEQKNVELTQGAAAAQRYQIINSQMSDSAKEMALALLQETEALKQKAAVDSGTAAKQGGIDQVTAGLKKQAYELSHGADALTLYELKTKGATAAELYFAEQLLKNIAAMKLTAAEKAATTAESNAAEAANRSFVEKSIQTAQRQNQTRMVSGTYLKLQEMAQRGATEAEIEEYYAAVQLTQKLDQQAAAYQRKTAAVQRSTGASQGHSSASTRNLMAMQSLAFGVQDAAQVYGNTGLAGALSASANNLIFMTQMLNPQLALFTALAVAGAQFAAVLLPMAFNAKKVGEETEKLTKIYETHSDVLVTMAEKRRAYANALEDATTRDSAAGIVKRTEREGQDLAGEIAARQQAIDVLQRRRKEAEEKEFYARQSQSTLGAAGEVTGFTAVEGVGEQKAIDDQIAEQRRKMAELKRQQQINAGQQTQAEQHLQQTDATQQQAESQKFAKEEREKRLKQDHEIVEERWKNEREAHEKFLKDKKALEQKTTMEQLDHDQAAKLKIMQDAAERQKQIDTWLAEGRIDAAEAMQLRMANKLSAGKSLSEVDQKAQEKARQDQQSSMEESVKEQKAALESETKKAPDLNAIEARSAEGLKAIFEALGGANDPQREIARNTRDGLFTQREALKAAEAAVKALKELKPIKTSK